jgi:hypothetical protein
MFIPGLMIEIAARKKPLDWNSGGLNFPGGLAPAIDAGAKVPGRTARPTHPHDGSGLCQGTLAPDRGNEPHRYGMAMLTDGNSRERNTCSLGPSRSVMVISPMMSDCRKNHRPVAVH